jgi:PKD repeat protein
MMPIVETGYKPAIGSSYNLLWTRDHAYTIWHDPSLLTPELHREFIVHRLARRSTAATGNGYANFIADRIASNGAVTYRNPEQSNIPFYDGIHFLVLMLWTDWNATGHTATFTAQKSVIDTCLAAIPRSANGCVYSDPLNHGVDYGFCDSVMKKGDVAYGTCLQAWAYKMLAEINGEDGSGEYTTLFNHAADGLATLRKANGYYKGDSTVNAAVDDVWATALAAAEGLIRDPGERLASGQAILDSYLAGTITQRGWVKHLPEPQVWAAGTGSSPGVYQNGGYWLTPFWDIYRAVSLVDQPLADLWRNEALTEVQRQLNAEATVGANTAPYEWFNGSTNSTPKGYTASAAIVNRFRGPFPESIPGCVLNLMASALVGSVSLTWALMQANPAITDYVVQYKSSASETWLTFADGTSTATSVTVTGLTNGTTYDFRVAAINALGTGGWSAVASATPLPFGTPPPPTYLIDARTLGLSEGVAVTTWPDLSTNAAANDVTQATAANRPTYRTAGVNGYPSVQFDGTDSLGVTSVPDYMTNEAGEYSVVAVFSVSNTSSLRGIVALRGASSGLFHLVVLADRSISFSAMGTTTSNASSPGPALDTPTLVIGTRDASGAKLYRDGVKGTDGAAGVVSPNNTAYPLTVGRMDASNWLYVGHIAYVAIYPGVLTDPQRQGIEDNLMTAFGIGDTGNIAPAVTITSLTAATLVATLAWTGTDPDGDTPLTYSINWGDGNTTPNAVSPAQHTYAAAGTYTVVITVTDARGGTGVDSDPITVSGGTVAGYPAEVLADAPSVYLRLAETSGTTAQDATANDRDGTYAGTYALNQGTLIDGAGSSVAFTGSGSGKVTVPYATWMQGMALTAECRIKTPASLASVVMMGRWGAGGGRQWLMSITNGYLELRVLTGGVDTARTATTGLMLPNTNYTLTMTYADSTKNLRGYVNGVKVIDSVLTGAWGTGGSEPFTAGGATVGVWSNQTLAEISLMPTVLSHARIADRHGIATGTTPPPVNPTVTLALSVDVLNATATWTSTGATALTFSINWGDGTTVPGAVSGATHAYSVPGTYTVTVTATDTGGLTAADSEVIVVEGAQDYPSIVLVDNPVVYVRLDETTGTVANDTSLNNRDGTYSAGVTLNQGSLLADGTGKSVLFSGASNSYVSFPSGTWNQLSAMTVEMRIKTKTNLNGTYLCGRWGGGGGGSLNSWLLHITNGYLTALISGYTGDQAATSQQMVANTEYTITFTCEAGGWMRGYVNGVKCLEVDIGGWNAASVVAPLWLGGVQVLAMGNTQMSEFSMYNTVLSDARIAEHHARAIAP